ncbi:hypothetical protein HG530_003327 [Fusarium avenaceum]|nr:hypothetical protein HG530_003327 [Fusarium avenaceum]
MSASFALSLMASFHTPPGCFLGRLQNVLSWPNTVPTTLICFDGAALPSLVYKFANPTSSSCRSCRRHATRLRSSSPLARHPTNSRCEDAQDQPSVSWSRFIQAAAPPAATAPAAPAYMAILPHFCHGLPPVPEGAGRAPAVFGSAGVVDGEPACLAPQSEAPSPLSCEIALAACVAL